MCETHLSQIGSAILDDMAQMLITVFTQMPYMQIDWFYKMKSQQI